MIFSRVFLKAVIFSYWQAKFHHYGIYKTDFKKRGRQCDPLQVKRGLTEAE